MARVANVRCAGNCGTLMWSGTTSLPEGQAMCRPCRAINWKHGTSSAYKTHACRCDECRDWNTKQHAAYEARRRTGTYPTTPCNEDGCERTAVA